MGTVVEPPTSRRAAHDPVLVGPVTTLLGVPDGAGVLVDATVGVAGHAAALLAASGPDVHLVGFDRDAEALELAARRLAAYGERVHLVHAGYDQLAEHVAPVIAAAGPLRGVLYDLGVSSLQLDRAGRGFSFRASGPLDMRMDQAGGITAAEVVNTTQQPELARLLRVYGEERYAQRIAAAIVRARPLTTTDQLAEVVTAAVPTPARHSGTHPATKTFQALRIVVNAELDRFGASLPQALELVEPAVQDAESTGGRIAVL
ncbi:MAG: 16S rRNA (cytosine(1402)-N(4))-methyltransferase RsmH, partial [Actinomycetota bacterium]|nr:16S rRNA (cytosine(1402)-N(4))-methyltransferase RsmH [Actinomycetota bacterium]